ncbi:MAG: hypothetical protein IPJ89_00185 [Candidatus Iainarchaeum archaeon]|uniref:Class III signal peptide-containing protein n=1 Tax=Candidatus Iainarchaeum sp. TaxID=3101447 RepID=A0A7T9DK02_9ARCH|nr:MAG: hypothetical protein IPJ89_00185 [Candidatus Diapherotrites archaeon]
MSHLGNRAQASTELLILVAGVIFLATIIGLIAKQLLIQVSPDVSATTNTVVNQLSNNS